MSRGLKFLYWVGLIINLLAATAFFILEKDVEIFGHLALVLIFSLILLDERQKH